MLAKKYGVENPEKFGLLLANHFLNTYPQVEEVHIRVDEYPWQRIAEDDIKCPEESNCEDQKQNFTTVQNRRQHNHGFVFTPTALRYCDIVLRRNGE